MKKIIAFIVILLLITGLGTGCGKAGLFQTEFSFDKLKIDFDAIKVSNGADGESVVLDEEKSKELYNTIKAVVFKQDKKAKDINGLSYSVSFQNKDKEEDSFLILDKNTIKYRGKLYKTASVEIDLDYLNKLFETTFKAVVIGTDSVLLVNPDKNSNEYKASDKIAVGTQNAGFYDKDGQEIDLSGLKAGDLVEISYNGLIMESYPAQISSSRIKVEDTTLIEGYLALIEDIYGEEKGLNGNIEMIALDTTELKDLSDLEKESLYLKLKDKYGYNVIEGTYDQLAEQGLIDKKQLYFEKGVLIKITKPVYDEKDKKITCGISKWRGGLGAVGSDNATARFQNNEWKVTRKGIWVS